MKHSMLLIVTAALALILAACSRQEEPAATVATVTQPQITEQTVATEPTLDLSGWEDVVYLVSPEGETTTAYLLADGRYMDRVVKVFTFDGEAAWTDEDGTVWTKAPEELTPQREIVHVEPVVDRLLEQRPDAAVYVDSESEYAMKLLFTFDETVTEVDYLEVMPQMDEKGDLKGYEHRPLFSLEQLTSDDLFVVQLTCEGLLPTRGIAFRNSDGVYHSYYLAESGTGVCPVLVEFH